MNDAPALPSYHLSLKDSPLHDNMITGSVPLRITFFKIIAYFTLISNLFIFSHKKKKEIHTNLKHRIIMRHPSLFCVESFLKCKHNSSYVYRKIIPAASRSEMH